MTKAPVDRAAIACRKDYTTWQRRYASEKPEHHIRRRLPAYELTQDLHCGKTDIPSPREPDSLTQVGPTATQAVTSSTEEVLRGLSRPSSAQRRRIWQEQRLVES